LIIEKLTIIIDIQLLYIFIIDKVLISKNKTQTNGGLSMSMHITVQKQDKEQLMSAIATIEKLPVENISGVINIPVYLSNGSELIFQVQGELKTNVIPSAPVVTPTKGKTKDEFQTVVSRQVADKIKQLRDVHGISNDRIAKMVGCNVATICNWVQGHGTPTKKVFVNKLMGIEVTNGKLEYPQIHSERRKQVLIYCTKNSMTKIDFAKLVSIPEDKIEPFLNEEWKPGVDEMIQIHDLLNK